MKFLRIPILQNTSGWLLLLLPFQKQPPDLFYEKRCSWKFRKNDRKRPVVWENLQKIYFTDPSGRLLLAFPATLLKWGTVNSVWKTSDECFLSRNTNLRSTVQLYYFFLDSINFQYTFSLFYTVHCQMKLPQQRRSV